MMKVANGINHIKRYMFFISFACLLCSETWAIVIKVPQDYASIASAMKAAKSGDEVIVAPGKYQDEVYFAAKDINLHSTFNDRDWSIINNTIIDGTVHFLYDETPNCRLRGFTILKGVEGRNSKATIEYNIIKDNASLGLPSGIVSCDGLIQNNIIKNNTALLGGAMNHCQGVIQNNLIYGNRALFHQDGLVFSEGDGGALRDCNGLIRNNTIVDNYLLRRPGEAWVPGGFAKCKGNITNNIIYHTTMTQPVELDASTSPSYCLFRTPRSGVGNITGDPKFADPAGGDYHLKPDSPAIDAGKSQSGLKADREGHQRGLKALGTPKGDGSGVDIGAYEAVPQPVGVWLPGGGPDNISEGDALGVSWELVAPAGASIRLRLYAGGHYLSNLGRFDTAKGSAAVSLPKPLATRSDYSIVGVSAASDNGLYYSSSATTMTITGTLRNAVAPRGWQAYF